MTEQIKDLENFIIGARMAIKHLKKIERDKKYLAARKAKGEVANPKKRRFKPSAPHKKSRLLRFLDSL